MRKFRVLILFVTALSLFNCSKKTNNFNSDFSLFKDYILNFSPGIISASDDIRVVLNFDNNDWAPNQELDSDLFSVSPKIDGKVVALSSNTVALIPKERLKQDTEYQISFHLDELKEVEKELKTFNFTARTIKQDFAVSILDLQSYSKDYQYVNCVLNSADNLDIETAKKLITATQNNKNLKIKFDADLSGTKEFKFVIDSIQRFEDDSKIQISWDGKSFDIDQKGIMEYDIHGKNNFKIVSVEVQEENNQVLLINFTDPLKKGQNFDGLVQVENANNLKFSTAGNLLKVFFNETLKGELAVAVFQGIESEDGYKMKKDFSQRVSFEQIKPQVRFLKSGTILPSSNNLKVNFEAVNLKAVDVKVYRIYQNNVLQFLQDNEINGNRNLRKVSAPVAKQTLQLKANNLTNVSKWNAYAVDLSKLITPEQGAIYRVELSFGKKYSLYRCEANEEDEEQVEDEDNGEVRAYDNYYYDYYYDYDWYDRDDPCTNSYYYNNTIGTNVLASDIGIIAKRSETEVISLQQTTL